MPPPPPRLGRRHRQRPSCHPPGRNIRRGGGNRHKLEPACPRHPPPQHPVRPHGPHPPVLRPHPFHLRPVHRRPHHRRPAIHWLDHDTFYAQAHALLRKPGGVLAAWCYTVPRVSPRVDSVYDRVYKGSAEHWAPERRFVDEELRTIGFPFEPVEGEAGTGPFEFEFEFEAEREMGLEGFLGYVRSWSAYETAKGRGVELLGEEVVEEFRRAWGGEGDVKVVKFPMFLRLGRVMDGVDTGGVWNSYQNSNGVS